MRNPRRLKCGSMNLDGYSKIRDMGKYGNIAKIKICKIEIWIPHNSELDYICIYELVWIKSVWIWLSCFCRFFCFEFLGFEFGWFECYFCFEFCCIYKMFEFDWFEFDWFEFDWFEFGCFEFGCCCCVPEWCSWFWFLFTLLSSCTEFKFPGWCSSSCTTGLGSCTVF